ncbi:CueP family metal-binding protein [Rothia uropygialis]|uniref:CueP family metal-binding protein n=1 Tax=Kocuria sp. 36 TaxID=1415402 RepID=UPI001876816C|nr:CueP family metal-binding protein [Kocuria sp. 36]
MNTIYSRQERVTPTPFTTSAHPSTSRLKHFAVIAAMTISAILLLSGCAGVAPDASPSAQSQPTLLSEHDLDGLDTREVIDRLDTMRVAQRPAELMASVQPDRLALADEQQRTKATLSMPDDEFYVSVAPYIRQTHECSLHSLTTCQGELRNTDIEVTVIDTATNKTVLDETLTTCDNGFVGLWLPRGIDATLVITADGRSGTQAISTRSDDPTCLTTLQLT